MPNIATKDFVEAKILGLKTKIFESKFQLVLWAFVFWATQLITMFGFLKFFALIGERVYFSSNKPVINSSNSFLKSS